MSAIAYLNGSFLPVEEARVPVLDRGFIFGDAIYELLPVYSRRPFRLREHLRRLDSNLAAIRLPNPCSAERWQELIGEMIARNELEDQSIYVQVTRGVAKRDHAFPKGVQPTVLIMSNPLVTPAREQVQNGVAAITVQDNRWLRCDIKATSLLANVLLRQRAVDSQAVEAILLRDGLLTEGAASNIFIVRGGSLLAPLKNQLMLPGITYDVVLELAGIHGLNHQTRNVSEQEVREAEELWMTSSTREVLAITTLDGNPVGSGKPGPVFWRMHGWYQEYKARVMRGA
ncbi:MAG: D-amino acid aminotransferase [Burkholderiales bacterium]